MRNLIFISITVLFFNCNDSRQAAIELADFHEVAKESTLLIPVTNQSPPTELRKDDDRQVDNEVIRQLIKTGSIEFQSTDIESDHKSILRHVQDLGAYVEEETQSRSDNRLYYRMTIRVPAERYDTLFECFSLLAIEVNRKSSNIQDVTEHYYDLKTRIRNTKVLEQRYLDLLSRAHTMSDILEIEQKLSEVRTKVENLEGQFRYLSKQISYSTISLSFYKELPYSTKTSRGPGFWIQISESLSWGWTGFLAFLVSITAIWPLIILIVMGVFGSRWYRKRKRQLS